MKTHLIVVDGEIVEVEGEDPLLITMKKLVKSLTEIRDFQIEAHSQLKELADIQTESASSLVRTQDKMIEGYNLIKDGIPKAE